MKLYTLDIDDLGEEELRFVRECFPLRYERSLRFVNPDDRLLSAAAAVLMGAVLGVRDESAVHKTPNGKPFIDGGPEFSIAHSGRRCVLAVSEGPVGVDIELLRESDLEAAPAVLTDAEREWIRPAPLERFHILWTRKESAYKAVGEPMDPREIEVLDAVCQNRLFIESTVADGYALSVCSAEKTGMPRPVNIKENDQIILTINERK